MKVKSAKLNLFVHIAYSYGGGPDLRKLNHNTSQSASAKIISCETYRLYGRQGRCGTSWDSLWQSWTTLARFRVCVQLLPQVYHQPLIRLHLPHNYMYIDRCYSRRSLSVGMLGKFLDYIMIIMHVLLNSSQVMQRVWKDFRRDWYVIESDYPGRFHCPQYVFGQLIPNSQ